MNFSLLPLFIKVSFQRCQSICAHKIQKKKVTKGSINWEQGSMLQSIKRVSTGQKKKKITYFTFIRQPLVNWPRFPPFCGQALLWPRLTLNLLLGWEWSWLSDPTTSCGVEISDNSPYLCSRHGIQGLIRARRLYQLSSTLLKEYLSPAPSPAVPVPLPLGSISSLPHHWAERLQAPLPFHMCDLIATYTEGWTPPWLSWTCSHLKVTWRTCQVAKV